MKRKKCGEVFIVQALTLIENYDGLARCLITLFEAQISSGLGVEFGI